MLKIAKRSDGFRYIIRDLVNDVFKKLSHKPKITLRVIKKNVKPK